MGTPDDATLVRAVLAGDRAAFGLLYDRHAPLVRALCYDATRNLAEAQDLAQDVLVRAFEKLATLRDQGQFVGWLVGITRLRLREWRRGNRRDLRRQTPMEAADAVAASVSDPDALEDLHAAIASLPERERLAVRVFYLQEQPVEAARAVMGVSRSGFYRLLKLARARLRQMLRCTGGIQ